MITSTLQRIYIALLNPIYSKHISKMDTSLREAYLKFIFYGFQIYFILYFSRGFKRILFSQNQRELLGVALIILATVFSIQEPLRQVKWKKRIILPLLLGAIGMIITGLMHPIGSGYMVFGIGLLLVFPGFYFVWNNRKDYETLFDIVASTNLEVGTLYFFYCMTTYRGDMIITNGERFQGSVTDPNLYSLVGMAMVCSAMYMIYRRRREKLYVTFCVLTLLMGLVVVILGQSRSGLMVAIAAILITGIFTLKNVKRAHIANSKMVLVVGIAILICIVSGLAIKATNVGVGNDSTDNGFIERFSFKGKDLNTFTSGRADIWANYAGKLNMTGNDFEEIDWEEMTGDTVKHAHNNFLEYGYRCGIPVAVAFTLLELFAGLITLKYLFARKWNRECYLFAVIFMCMYAVMSMIDIATIPMERYAPFAFYLILAVLMDADENSAGVSNLEQK